LTPEDFFAVFDTFHVSALRLETLPAYDVGDYGDEANRLRAFREGLPVPERSVLTDPWLGQVARSVLAGKTWDRVRIVDHPLTEYQRFELGMYAENQVAGERVVLAPRVDVDEGPDVWLIDAGTPDARAVVMRYGPGGKWLGADLEDDLRIVADHAERARRVQARAVPLNAFVAGMARG
jgi:hypothetical protein